MKTSQWALWAAILTAGAVLGALVHFGPGSVSSQGQQRPPTQMAQAGKPSAGAAYADEEEGEDQQQGGKTDVLDRLLAAVAVNDGVSYRGLTLFPVTLRRDGPDFSPRTFDEAVEKGDLVVREVGGGEVNAVKVKNNGGRAVFIMAGEIMTGSKQDRTVQRDVLIPPESGWVRVPVYCVEHGRWVVTSPQFGTRRALAMPQLRTQAYAGAGQAAIWDQVDVAARAQGVEQSAGKPLQEIYDSPAVQARLEEYTRALRLPRDQRLVGLVAFAGQRALGADLFGSPAVFGALRDKLIKSYVLALGVPPATLRIAPPEARPDAHEAARFLARAWSQACPRTAVKTPGIGRAVRLHNARANTGGGALLYEEGAVHMSLFPEPASVPVPEPDPDLKPIPIPIPRLWE